MRTIHRKNAGDLVGFGTDMLYAIFLLPQTEEFDTLGSLLSHP